MRPATLVILGTIAYAAFLAASLPASVVAARIEAASGGRIAFAEVNGTWGEGNASLDIRTATVGTLPVDELRWNWRPAELLRGRAAFDVEGQLAGLRFTGQAARSVGEWQLRDLRGSGEAGGLVALFPIATAWQPAGAVAIESPLLAFDGGEMRGNASAEWRDAFLSLSTARPLGSWRATLVGNGGPAKVTLATAKGPLRLVGGGTLVPNGRFTFSGEARAEPGREKELEGVLGLLGPRRADGAHAIEIR